MFVYIIKQI